MQLQAKRLFVIGGIILIASITRLIPHPMNFAPLGAMALFGAAYFGNRGMGLLITMLSWFFTDLILNNFMYPTDGITLFTFFGFFSYASIILIYALGSLLLQKVTAVRMIVGSLSASVIFFLVSNFGVWLEGMLYPQTMEGLVACYAAAIPFVKNTLAGDLFYSGVLFLLYERYLRSQLVPRKV